MIKTSIYSSVDECIRAWSERNSLTLFTLQADREIRGIYVSSKAGECYQIWIDPPDDGEIAIHAACVEGPKRYRGVFTGLEGIDFETGFQPRVSITICYRVDETFGTALPN